MFLYTLIGGLCSPTLTGFNPNSKDFADHKSDYEMLQDLCEKDKERAIEILREKYNIGKGGTTEYFADGTQYVLDEDRDGIYLYERTE
jgi:hypothetical protein